jgi:hypothetical protein
MVLITNHMLLTLVVMAASATTVKSNLLRAQHGRGLTDCDSFKGCYLVNLQTREETELTGTDKFEMDESNEQGYSIRCDVNGKDGESDYIKFFYNGIIQDEYGLPRYMNGDSESGKWINPVPYLATCGIKTLKIEGHVWSQLCFDQLYTIEMKYPGNKSCDVISAPTPPVSPSVPAPVKAPVVAPTAAPILAPVLAPIFGAPTLTCKPGWKVVGKCCKKVYVCPNDYRCPLNSQRIPGRQCYDGFADCECLAGFIRTDTQCVKKGTICAKDYQCPPNSTRRADRYCYNSINDCKCNQGYSKENEQCVPTKWCP